MNKRDRFFDEKPEAYRQILTPEGVMLTVRLADRTDRAVAFIIDVSIWCLVLFLIYLSAALLQSSRLGTASLVPLLLFAAFVIRVAYFIHFELAWQGATPGKRMTGLRVIDRQGGPLLPSAVIARNLTREFEIFLPIGVSLSLASAADRGLASLLSMLWILCLGALPLLNRDRLRGGDLIAGTMVIALSRRGLAADLAEGDFHYAFTDRQLMAYGAFELQVLEELLRGARSSQSELMRSVGERIRRKIGWTQDVPPERELLFLRDFYAAERRFLEGQQLLGRLPQAADEKPSS